MNAVRARPAPAAVTAEPPAPVEFDKQVAQLVNAAATPPPPERPAPAPQLPRRPAYQYD